MKIHVEFLLTFLWFLLATSDSCKYKKFSENHSFCKEANKECDLMKSEVTDADKKLIVKKHNEYRSKIARGNESRAGGMPEASNMMEMVWDNELASIAQKWANQCEFKHDCPDCRKVGFLGPRTDYLPLTSGSRPTDREQLRFSVGQNIYTISSTGEAESKRWEDMTDSFYEEIKNFDKNNIQPSKSNTNYGHFTQLVWATSCRIGCGEAVYKESGQNISLFVCNYGPGGNIDGGEMYKEGKPCSDCKSGTCCCDECKKSGVTSDFSGLCKVLDKENFKIDDATE